MNLSHLAQAVKRLFDNGAKAVNTNGMKSQEKEATDARVASEQAQRATKAS